MSPCIREGMTELGVTEAWRSVAADAVQSYHVQAIQDLIAHIAADTHVRSPGCGVQGYIGCFVLGFEARVQLLAGQQESVGNGCAGQACTHAHKGKQEPLQQPYCLA